MNYSKNKLALSTCSHKENKLIKKNLLAISVTLVSLLGAANASASEEVHTWSCQDSKQFKTTGSTDKVRLTWDSKSYDLERQASLPGSLRYKNINSGFDLVVLGNKAMLFNIKAGVRLADFCQTADMKTGKMPHLFASAEPFMQN